jgi:hypothetical protein
VPLGPEFSFDLGWSANSRHLIIPLSVGLDFALEMLPLPQERFSAISPRAIESLQAKKLLLEIRPGSYFLEDLRIKGEPVADLEVRISGAPAIAGVEGVLGRDFFAQFADVRWDPGSNRITLVRRST